MTRDEKTTAPEDTRSNDRRCGYVTLLGAPNVGKSTLLNALVGEDLSIVTAKAQTTWQRVIGIRTSAHHQLVLLDTPGIVTPKDLLHRSLLLSAQEAAHEADILVVVVDPLEPLGDRAREGIREILIPTSAVRMGVVNKVDAADPHSIDVERTWLKALSIDSIHSVSATSGAGLEALLGEMEGNLPAGPFLFPEDEIASAPVRFFVSEFVRQEIFERFREEIPYSCMCRVEEFRDEPKRTYIQVTIYAERSSQKGILIGDGGSAIRALGTAARERIEHFLDCPVYLDLWVKVLPGWRRKPELLRRLGLPVPQEDRVR